MHNVPRYLLGFLVISVMQKYLPCHKKISLQLCLKSVLANNRLPSEKLSLTENFLKFPSFSPNFKVAMEDLIVIVNYSELYSKEFSEDITLVHCSYNMLVPVESVIMSKSAGFGIASGIMIAFLINFVLSFEVSTIII